MKAWEVVGWTGNAEVYCLADKPEGEVDGEGNEYHPIFMCELSEHSDEVCAVCHERLGD